MFKKSYKERLRNANIYAEKQKEKQEIYNIKHKNDKPKKGVAWSKLLLLFILADCLVIQIFSMYMMYYLADSSSIPSLLGVAVPLLGQVVSLASYNKKSTVENSVGGIVYESMMAQLNNADNSDEEGVVG